MDEKKPGSGKSGSPADRELWDDEVMVASSHKKRTEERKPAKGGKTPPVSKAKAKSAQQSKAPVIAVSVAVFLVMIAVIVAVGLAMSNRAGTLSGGSSGTATQVPRDEKRSYFKNDGNRPELSSEGVKAKVVEAYFAADGRLAVTLSLSNGTESTQTVTKVGLRLYNGDQDDIAAYTFDTFEEKISVGAGQYAQTTLVIPAKEVKLPDDPLTQVGSTIEVSAVAE